MEKSLETLAVMLSINRQWLPKIYLKDLVSHMNVDNLANLLQATFATDLGWHAEQQADGTYRKRQGATSTKLLKKILLDGGSLAVYQKNIDHSVKWICFDFDVIKSYLETQGFITADAALKGVVRAFCLGLDDLEIPYLLEFSGNRGYHVWITFVESIPFQTAYEIQQALLTKIDPKYDHEVIAIDLFPSSATPTDGVGIGVKIPLSKHAKSKKYSILIGSVDELSKQFHVENLTKTLVASQEEILGSHKGTSRREIEEKLDLFFDISTDDQLSQVRIKSVLVQKDFSLEELVEYWAVSSPLSVFSLQISTNQKLNNETRKLLVGILANVRTKAVNVGKLLLHNIFERIPGYNEFTTNNAIAKLSSFSFPSQEQIEKTAGKKFDSILSPEDLLKCVIPNYESYEDATFELNRRDIESVRVAELNYLFMNDEARAHVVIDQLSNTQTDSQLSAVKDLIDCPENFGFYLHSRLEKEKLRKLVTLEAPARLFTSSFLKQLVYFLDFAPSENSYGYRVNKGFKHGFIFQPWLYLWIKFLSNVDAVISDPKFKDFYILKIDISNFYDTIPHNNLKRLLMGGVNPRIDERLKSLSPANYSLYKTYIDVTFRITERLMKSRVGLPQGPAYARYFAELYLDNLDQKLSRLTAKDQVVMYQRYVDDIFIVCETEAGAKQALLNLQSDLKVIGLRINENKTKVAKIGNFVNDFDEYKSQAKYAVDHASRDFYDATEAQQNLAINEFTNLLVSENCDEDLNFVFSHLTGIADIDSWKREKFFEVMTSRIGRGTLFKNMFNFAIEDQENWPALLEVENYSDLQSEVLTSAIIEAMKSEKQKRSDLAAISVDLWSKLTRTDLVDEHLAYLVLVFGVELPLEEIPPHAYIKCIRSISDVDSLHVTIELTKHINTFLNDIKPLKDFVEATYPLCASRTTGTETLNELADVFYAKISGDYEANILLTSAPLALDCAASVAKFTYLVCLFCASVSNGSEELLKAMWKCCILAANAIENGNSYVTQKWYAKIDQIELHQEKALLLISGMVDGSIVRGATDQKNVFEGFHNIFLLFMAFQDSSIYSERVQEGLEKLKDFGIFYQWLVDRDSVKLFPDLNRAWFEKNLVDNGTVILQRGNQILFRKPTGSFDRSTNAINEHNGYSEALFEYFPAKYTSLREHVNSMSVHERLAVLMKIVDYCDSELFPNIYCNERILEKVSLEPFTAELKNAPMLIFEDFEGAVSSAQNNKNNFVRCFFNAFSANDEFKTFKEKYLDNMDERSDLIDFIRNFVAQLMQMNASDMSVFYDFAFSAALHISLQPLTVQRRIEKFVEFYHKFHSDDTERHVYGVKKGMSLNDTSPYELLNSVAKGLELIVVDSVPGLSFNLYKDIESYRLQIESVAASNSVSVTPLNISDFTLTQPQVLGDNRTLRVENVSYDFSNVFIFSMADVELKQFSTIHRARLSASHIYKNQQDGKLYLLAVDIPISKIYLSMRSRYAHYIESFGKLASYPPTAFNSDDIRGLAKFDAAVRVIEVHRGLSHEESETLLIKWLKFLPKTHHLPLVTLIAAHRVMSEADIERFLGKVAYLLKQDGANPFLIKKISDYNGTHRLLYRDNKLGRTVDSLSPICIKAGATSATIIVDCIISGTQIINAIKYYATGEGAKPSANYFILNNEESSQIKSIFAGLRELHICTVLYTAEGLKKINQACKDFIHPDLNVSVIEGRDIGDDAYFGSTSKIGESEKNQIRALLKDQGQMALLLANLNVASRSMIKLNSDESINKINVVTRFKSLPKKCFDFLHHGLAHDERTYPLTRVLEAKE